MIDTPTILETERRDIAIIPLDIPMSDMRIVMGPGIGELLAAVSAQGIGPIGAWFNHGYEYSAARCRFEIGVAVSSPVTPTGRVLASVRPALRVARTIYRGPYEGLGDAWGEFETWIAKNAPPRADDLWETYAVGPESGDDATKWETILERPLHVGRV